MAAPIALEPDKVLATVEALRLRIEERFPGSGLSGIATHLARSAAGAVERAEAIRRPLLKVRVASALLLAAMAALLGFIATRARRPQGTFDALELVQAVEATLSALALLGVTVLFVMTLESRSKRRRALEALHELRVLAHVIDMHQLTKDPERLQEGFEPTRSSPEVALTPFLLGRYLNYCGDLLALVGKVAAYYLASVQDEVVLAAVNEIEELTNGLSRKIWQKLMLLDQMVHGSAPSLPAAAPRPPPSAK